MAWNDNVSREQEAAEYAALQQLTRLILKEQTFLDILKRRFDSEKDNADIIRDLVENFGQTVSKKYGYKVVEDEQGDFRLLDSGNDIVAITAANSKEEAEAWFKRMKVIEEA